MEEVKFRGIFNSVHIADLHFSAFDPRKQYEILRTQFLDKIINLASIDLIEVAGDIFDHKLMANSDGIYYATKFIDELIQVARIKNAVVILLHGTFSHDSDQLKLFYHYQENSDVDVRVVTHIQFEQVKNCKILCIPELYGVNESVYQKYLTYSGFYDEAIMHGTFEGSVYNNIVGNGRLFTIHDFKMCRGFMVGGHVHKPGCFSGYFYYCGCPYRWKFGEEEDKGFLICSHDLDTHQHYVHFEKIYSDNYITIDLEDIVGNDPRAVIAYIDDLKKSQGIDYLKVRFRYPVAGADKVIINNNYRENHNIFVEFMNISEEQKAKTKQASGAVIDDDYSFILDDKLSDMEKFVKYANYQEGYEFITVDKLKQILSEGF